MTDFARSQLLKYGWSEGKGLGKNENGITEALKPKLKFDTTGVGHESSEYNWWQFVYNKASNNIDINNEDGDVKMRIKDKNAVEIATSKSELNLRRMKKDSNYNLHFGNFIKTSTLQDGKDSINDSAHESVIVKSSPSMSEFPSELNDEALFKACGGRTAHKGARHGHTLSGKLARLQQQEEELLAQMKNSSNPSEPSTSSPWTQFESKKSKKNRKRKSDLMDLDDDDDDDDDEDSCLKINRINNVKSVPGLDSGDRNECLSVIIKSKKARLNEKRKFESLINQMEKSLDLTTAEDEGTESEKKKNKKKRKKKKKDKNGSVVDAADDGQAKPEEVKKKKKKKKNNGKMIEVVNLDDSNIEVVNLVDDENTDDPGFYEISGAEESTPKSKKKKKNKSNKEVMNADKLNGKIIIKKNKKLEKKKNDKLAKLSESLVTLALDDAIVDNVTAKVKLSPKERKKKRREKKNNKKKSKKQMDQSSSTEKQVNQL